MIPFLQLGSLRQKELTDTRSTTFPYVYTHALNNLRSVGTSRDFFPFDRLDFGV